MSEVEKRKYKRTWQIEIDKNPRHVRDRIEAEEMLEVAEALDYDTMFMKSAKEIEAYKEKMR